MPRSSSGLLAAGGQGSSNGKALNSGATDQWVHTDSTNQKRNRYNRARGTAKTAAMRTAAALIRHIYQRGREGYEVDVVTNFCLFRFRELSQPICGTGAISN
jgi:hypothetical protein